ncbi:MAG: hypothetical protein ACW99A_16590 [Candidatus Kariarchaeaceae archaeon]
MQTIIPQNLYSLWKELIFQEISARTSLDYGNVWTSDQEKWRETLICT